MKKESSVSTSFTIITLTLLTIMSLFLLITGTRSLMGVDEDSTEREEYNKRAKTVEAVVTGERMSGGGTGKNRSSTTYYYYLLYEVNGVEYRDGYIKCSTHSYEEGEIITIHYDPEDPTHITKSLYNIKAAKMSNLLGSIFVMVIGAILAVVVIYNIVHMFKNKKEEDMYY